ncbi:hypothetical protein SapgrDRAFT_1723 [Saprospira grandis DSM 2844]|uniref:Lipoprotein n=1 Tax=Saprospira grandis DSM 2844 TaxID=694433 RepID=J0P7D6_9BACT|nr:hypothetical protein [Saprospira grandis]EJF53427.1 hypothetical protein SapgrDRAFT_1723 [Saprospira grandis DSM 2844]
MKQILSIMLLASLLFACQSSKKLAKNNIIQDSHWTIYECKLQNPPERIPIPVQDYIMEQYINNGRILLQDSMFYLTTPEDKVDAKIIARQEDHLLLYDPKQQKEIKFPYELDVKNKKCVFHLPGIDGQGEILLYSEQIPMP